MPGVPKRRGCRWRAVVALFCDQVVEQKLFATAYSRCFDVQCIGLRYFNVFGPRRAPSNCTAVIPTWVAAVLRGEQVYINGDSGNLPDFCFIDNVVQANLRAATTLNPNAVNHVYNIAAGRRTTLNQLYGKIRGSLAGNAGTIVDVEPTYQISGRATCALF